MFTDQTYELIKQRMMDNITDNIDKREGSFTNNMVSAKSNELARAYFNMNSIIDMAFIQNNSFTFLDMKVNEWGLSRKQGSKATGSVTVTGTNGISLSNGTVIECNGLRYIMLNDVVLGTDNIAHIEALEIGTEYNLLANSIFTLAESVTGVTNISNSVALTGGTDIESDESLLDRYYTYIRKTSTSGNKNDYYNWAMEVDGCGDAKIFDATQLSQPGRVMVVIIDSNKTGADGTLIANVKDNIEKKRPLGSQVAVVSATEKAINISATIVPADGYTIDQIKQEIIINVTKYLYDNAFRNSYVSVARIGNVILDTDGVFDYSNFTVNGSTNNITLEDTEVAVLGTVTVVI